MQITINPIPMTFHCSGMMRIIKQLLREKIPTAKLSNEDLNLLLTEYAKYWYYSFVKGYEAVTAEGKRAK